MLKCVYSIEGKGCGNAKSMMKKFKANKYFRSYNLKWKTMMQAMMNVILLIPPVIFTLPLFSNNIFVLYI